MQMSNYAEEKWSSSGEGLKTVMGISPRLIMILTAYDCIRENDTDNDKRRAVDHSGELRRALEMSSGSCLTL